MHEVDRVMERVEALAARDDESERGAEFARAIEDLLCEGYVAVLELDSRIRRLERRQSELGEMVSGPEERRELRELEEQRQCLESSAADGRRSLGGLRQRFVRLGGAQATAR